MSPTRSILRSISSLILGFITALIVFALVLSLFWAVIPQTPAWKLAGALISSALALCAGGFVVTWLSKTQNWILPAAFGFFLGGFSFTYLLGLTWSVLSYTAASTLSAYLGGIIFHQLVHKGTSQAGPGTS
jgi:hypothetical protein